MAGRCWVPVRRLAAGRGNGLLRMQVRCFGLPGGGCGGWNYRFGTVVGKTKRVRIMAVTDHVLWDQGNHNEPFLVWDGMVDKK